jgi:hypothetical protein
LKLTEYSCNETFLPFCFLSMDVLVCSFLKPEYPKTKFACVLYKFEFTTKSYLSDFDVNLTVY